MSEVSTERYVETWENHISELTRMGWYLNADQQDELADLQDQLNELVKRAAQRKIVEEQS